MALGLVRELCKHALLVPKDELKKVILDILPP